MNTPATTPTTVVNVATGEILELETAPPVRLAHALTEIGEYLDHAHEYRQTIVDELARRADARGERTVITAGVKYEVNAPSEDVYTLEVLRDNLEGLIAAGILDEEVLGELIVEPPPKRQPKRVAKARINALLKSDDRRILAAIHAARRRMPTKRTARILHVAVDATATERDA